MRKLLGLLLIVATSACVSVGTSSRPPAPAALAVAGVHVVDVESGRVIPDNTVVISGGRIVTIGRTADVRVPAGARVIDGAGKYLIPGLWDMHTHVAVFGPTAMSLLLAHGVTGIRDMGAERFAEAKALRDSIAAGLLLGPRMKISSPVVESARWLAWAKQNSEKAGTPWTLYERFGPRTPEEAVRWVDSVAALGADHIKVRNWPVMEISQALVARAKERGVPVVGHANQPFPRAGVATYEHHVWPPLNVSEVARDTLWRQWAANGAAFVPTLVMWPPRTTIPDTLLARIDGGTLPGFRYVPATAREAWRNEVRGWAQDSPVNWPEIVNAAVRDLREMHRAGVPVLAGTDVGAPFMVPGLSLHDELAQLVTVAGFTPLDALRAATVTPARLMVRGDSLGTVEVGQLADLVLLDANPLENIQNTRRINAVISSGRLLDRQELDRLLREAAEAARSARSTGLGRTTGPLVPQTAWSDRRSTFQQLGRVRVDAGRVELRR